MPADSIDVTVVLNGHREGMLIHRTLRSILRAVDFASDTGIRCEIVAVLDRPDEATADYFARTHLPVLRTVQVDYGDPGVARNRGVSESAGAYVAFVDGDDLVSRNWLTAAFAFSERQRHCGRRFALHPETNIFFGGDFSILPHVDQESEEWSLGSLFAANYWTALAFTRKDDLVALPFRSATPHSGFGYEDWDWNCMAVGAGMVHKVVPSTWHFIRVKHRGSRNQQAETQNLLVRPSPVFDTLETPVPTIVPRAISGDGAGVAEAAEIQRILGCPDLLAEWRDLARLEPELFPSSDRLARYKVWKPSLKEVGDLFGEILRRWGKAPSHVLVCDRFAEGDAGRAAFTYACALADLGADVTVIVGEENQFQVPAARRKAIRLLELGGICTGSGSHWPIRLLGRALLQRPPKTLHIIESLLGYETIEAYGLAISRSSRIFSSILHSGWSLEGERTGYAVSHFPRIAPYLSGFLSDNDAVLDWVCDTYGYPRENCHTLRAAVEPDMERTPARKRPEHGKPGVLWVGDMGHQSCPAMLLKIACLMPDWTFVVFTEPDADEPPAVDLQAAIQALPNVVFADRVSCFDDAMVRVSVLLYTGLVDALSGAHLKAAAAGLPIVTPALRAIREFIDDDTGYLVRDYHRPEAYVDSLREVMGKPDIARRRVENAQHRLREQHAWTRLLGALQLIKGYL